MVMDTIVVKCITCRVQRIKFFVLNYPDFCLNNITDSSSTLSIFAKVIQMGKKLQQRKLLKKI